MAQRAPAPTRPAPPPPPAAYTAAPAPAPAPAAPPPAATSAPAPPLPAAVGGLHKAVRGNTFLAGAKMTAEMFLEAGEEFPLVGPLLKIMLVFIKALNQHRKNEEECERLAVWVHALMGSFAKAAREGRVDADSTYLIKAAETALQKLVTLVESRLDRTSGWFGRVKAFWTSKEFKEEIGHAESGLHRALDALLAMVSVETKRDVALVLNLADRLPFMDQKLEAVLWTIQGVSDKVGGMIDKVGGIDAKMDTVMQRLDEMQRGLKQRGKEGSIFDTFQWAPFSPEEWRAREGDDDEEEEDLSEEERSVLGKGKPPSAPCPCSDPTQAHASAGAPPVDLDSRKYMLESIS